MGIGTANWFMSRKMELESCSPATGELQRDNDGSPTAILEVNNDITERKQSEADLKRRAAELERFNRLAAGRELRSIELKQEVNDLAARLGRPRPYALAFMDTAAAEVVRTTPKPAESPSVSEPSQTSNRKE